jgi:hypothetical protein
MEPFRYPHNCDSLRANSSETFDERGNMSRHSSSPFASVVLIATPLMLGAGVIVPANLARAEDCLAAPNSAAPQGSHWFYKLDPATKRKCWYVRVPGQPAQQAAAPAKKSPATSLHATPAPSGREAAPAPVSPGDADQRPAQIEMHAVKPPVPGSGAAPEDTAPSTAPAAPANTSVEPRHRTVVNSRLTHYACNKPAVGGQTPGSCTGAKRCDN